MIDRQPFGCVDGSPVERITLAHSGKTAVSLSNFGATILSIQTPDHIGKTDDIVLGYDTLTEYLADTQYFGCMVGRCANRIAGGNLMVDGKRYLLSTNDGKHHLHGGDCGFNKRVWNIADLSYSRNPAVTFAYVSPDGEEGYPGNLSVRVTYALDADDQLNIDVRAETDHATAVNIANHAYFNLAGQASADCCGHILTIHANDFLPVDGDIIPTGVIASVKDTPMDFTRNAVIGDRLGIEFEQTRLAGGFDHNWVLNKSRGEFRLAATAACPVSGRILAVSTTQPGLQFYSGNFLDGTVCGKAKTRYGRHAGFCLEAQGFPDAVNQPRFPSTILKPGETYRQLTQYRFSVYDPNQEE